MDARNVLSGTVPPMPTTITPRGSSATSFDVTTGDSTGSVEATGRGWVVYVPQPERPPVVEGSDVFAASIVDLAGVVTRWANTVSETAFEAAEIIWAVFASDADTPARATAARAALVDQVRAVRAETRGQVNAQIGELRAYLDHLDGLDEDLDRAAGDPAVELPFLDTHLRHQALWVSR